MRRLGVIDLGSNTSRLAVFAYQPGRWFRLVDEIREPIRLGESLWRDNRLTPQAMGRGEAAIRLYAHYRQAMGLEEIEAIATSAVRDAENGEDFLKRVEPFGLPIKTLSGTEEAGLGVLAVANGFNIRDAWVMDLGGGSVQISEMRDRRMVSGESYPLGGVRLSEAFLNHDPPWPEEIERLERRIEDCLGSVLEEMRSRPAPLVAMGGTVRNLARAVQKKRRYPLDRVHGYFLARDDLERLSFMLGSVKAPQRARIPGIHPDRADFIVAGAAVYRRLAAISKEQGIWISGQGVREGAFYRRFVPEPHLTADVRQFSLRNLFEQYPQSEVHTRRVRGLSRRLFEETAPLHDLGEEDACLLDAAAWLHDVGMTLGYRDHHKHGAYLLSSSVLSGFTHREQAFLIQLVRYHRKGSPRLGDFKRLPDCREDDRERLLKLAACLRLAEDLERSRSGHVRNLRMEISARKVRLKLEAAEPPFIENLGNAQAGRPVQAGLRPTTDHR